MKARLDARVEDLHEVLDRYGPSDVSFEFFHTITRTAPGDAGVKLSVAYKPGAPQDDPWELRSWQMAQVKQCIADLAGSGWYLCDRLRLEYGGSVRGGVFTLEGDLHIEPEQFMIGCTADFRVQGFPPK
jgi:hypothetical protein